MDNVQPANKAGGTGKLGATSNLLNTVLGGGISLISLPLAAKQAGVVIMPTLEIVSFVASCYTLHMLVVASHSTGEPSYAALGSRFLGRAHLCVPIFIVLNNLGVCVAFLEVFADVVPPLLQKAFGESDLLSRQMLLVYVTVGLLIPVATVRNIAGFVMASLAATFCATAFAVFGTIAGIISIAPGGQHNPLDVSRVSGLNSEPSFADLLSAISLISLSWTCQFNVLPIFASLEVKSVSEMRTVIVTAMGIAVLAYIAFGVFAYLNFLAETTGDTLADFDDTQLGQVLRVAVVVALVLTFPLFVFEGAHNIDHLLTESRRYICGPNDAKDCKALHARTRGTAGRQRLGSYLEDGSRASLVRASFTASFTASFSESFTASFTTPVVDHSVILPTSTGGTPSIAASDPTVSKEHRSHPDAGELQGEPLWAAIAPHTAQGEEEEEEEEDHADAEWARIRVEGAVLTVLAGGIAILVKDTSAVIGLVGCACGIPISYVLPPLIFIFSEWEQGNTQPGKLVVPGAVCALGTTTSIACVINTLLNP